MAVIYMEDPCFLKIVRSDSHWHKEVVWMDGWAMIDRHKWTQWGELIKSVVLSQP